MRMNRLFDPNNLLFRELSHLVDLVGLSLLWLLLSVPVVTLGPATAALYHTAVKGLRRGDPATFTRYLRSFRENLKEGTLVTLVLLPLALLMKLGLDIMVTNAGREQGMLLLVIYVAVLLIPVGCLCWLFPLLGRFSFSVTELFQTALRLTLAHLPVTMLIAAVTAGVVVLMGLLVWPVLLLPMLTALVLSFPMERVFARYMTQEEEDPLAEGEEL